MVTLSQRIKLSPQQCRLLARKAHGYRLMTNRDIARRAGLSPKTISKIAHLTTWEGLTLGIIDRYARGCGVDLLAPSARRDRQLIHRNKLACFAKATLQQRRMLHRILSGLAGANNSR